MVSYLGILEFSGRVKCFHGFDRSDLKYYEDEFKANLRRSWSFIGESGNLVRFRQGEISGLRIIADYSLNRVISQFMFTNVKSLDDVRKLLNAVLEGALLCNLIMRIDGLSSGDVSRIGRVVKRFKCSGFIMGGDANSFRCSVSLGKYAYSLAVYGDLNAAEVIAKIESKIEVDKLISSLKVMLKPSFMQRFLECFTRRV